MREGNPVMKLRKVLRSTVIALAAAGLAVGGGQAANATPAPKLSGELAQLWTTILETPSAENSFGAGAEAYACWDLGGHVVAPFAPPTVPVVSCTVKPGTRILVVGGSTECSTFEVDFPPCGPRLYSSAKAATLPVPSVTVDGRTVPLIDASVFRQEITLPDDNLFGVPAGTSGRYAAYGWVTLLNPLPPGTHTIVGPTFSTTIVVQPGLH